MTFSRYNPSGYGTGARLPSGCINQHDRDIPRALDGYGGGTYAPSSAVIVQGAGLGGYVYQPLTFQGSNNFPRLSTRSLTRPTRGQWVTDASHDSWITHGTSGYWTTSAVGTTGQILTCRETLESGSGLVSVTFYTQHGAHNTSWPPQHRTQYVLRALNLDTGASEQLALVSDTEGQSTYEDVHDVVVTADAHTWLATEILLISVISEYGTNAVVNTSVYGATVTQSFTDLRPV